MSFNDIFKVTYKGRDDAVKKIMELNKKRLSESGGKVKNNARNEHRATKNLAKKEEALKQKLAEAGIEL